MIATVMQSIMNPFIRFKSKILFILFLVSAVYLTAWALRILRFDSYSATIGFGCAAETICFSRLNEHLMEDNFYIFPGGGYDGQFYYYAAAGMYSGQKFTLDAPDLRLSRIGYPLLTGWIYPLFGGRFLIFGMTLIPFFFHLLSVYLIFNTFQKNYLNTLLFALNPFSLLSFLLNLSDGLALSIAAIGISFAIRDSGTGWNRRSFFASFFLAFAVLTKETMMVVPAGLFLNSAADAVFSRIADKKLNSDTLQSLKKKFILSLAAVIPFFIWLFTIGYSFSDAASHGGFPFSFMQDPVFVQSISDSSRMMLIVIFFLLLFFLLFYTFRHVFLYGINQFRAGPLLFACGVISLSSREYWVNYANIARLFTPAVLGWILCGTNGKIYRYITVILFVLFLWSDFSIIREDFRGLFGNT